MSEPDLFALEMAALAKARATHGDALADGAEQRRMLGELIVHFERLMRESRRLIRRSDSAERAMNQLNRQLNELAGQLAYRASHDALTGALNRAALIDAASACLQRGDAALVVLDLDHFKQVNDDFGHPAGDAVIRSVVQCLMQLVSQDGMVGRVGGEEFCIVWPSPTPEAALVRGQLLCRAVAQLAHAAPLDRAVTASVGLSWNPRGIGFDAAYARADEALYEAKRGGRNRVKMAGPARVNDCAPCQHSG